MTRRTCFLCKYSDGLVEDTWNLYNHKHIKCEHKISVGNLDLQIIETESLLRDMKKARQYAKIIGS